MIWLHVSLGVCRSFQKENQDLAEALNLADDVLAVTGEMSVFAELFASVAQLGRDVDVELVKPRLFRRQTNRCNFDANTAEAYSRIAMFVPFADSFCAHLTNRLLMHRNVLSDFMYLLPVKNLIAQAPTSGQISAMKQLSAS